ncbi:MAG TPA: 50S ribosomal protein L24 [Candidatus Paceibacterota bacterium]|nr:50S ribosomal protein L24 [Candidatus Paceibacterota bacterium]
MKNKFSAHWKSSKQTRKQRKYRANAPIHIQRKFLSVNLNKDLRKKYNKRNFPIRKGDEVKIMKGSEKGKKGKISIVNLERMKIAIEGIQRKKKEGTKINLWFEPSNVQIQELNLSDKMRLKSLNRKVAEKKENKKKEKKNA